MAQAVRDSNRITSLICTSIDGVTPVAIMADPISHSLGVETAILTYPVSSVAKRDQNYVPTLLAVSSVDGVTPVVVYADPITQELLIENVP